MRLHYDKKQDALYIKFNENHYLESEEVQDGIIFDYDEKRKIIGIEVLDASRRFPIQFRRQLQKHQLPISLTVESKVKNA
ncbi:MAG: DUF2283 domain-containing protein [Parcubacteria group bacterium]|nr:DUF2283 domain-containing protein [Parcubacteria group bacterium]